jgi:hypothetical protein
VADRDFVEAEIEYGAVVTGEVAQGLVCSSVVEAEVAQTRVNPETQSRTDSGDLERPDPAMQDRRRAWLRIVEGVQTVKAGSRGS